MPLSDQNISDIAKEFAATYAETADSKSAIPGILEQIAKKEEQTTRLYIAYNNSQVERVRPYQTERQWLDGTTYSDIPQSQIDDAAKRTLGNAHFPQSWYKTNAMLTANGNGNPTSVNSGGESVVLNASLPNQGLISQIDFLINGQSSGVGSNALSVNYSPGQTSITLMPMQTQTPGKYLYIAGSGTSALVLVTSAAGVVIGISEIIPPAGTISFTGSSVVENIPGFTNGERQSLSSGSYQRILTELTNRILSAAALWKTSLDNQLTQLTINIDSPAQITAAKTSVNAAITAYGIWFALSNTGVTGKFADTSLADLATSYNSRNSGIAARAGQITTALGSVSQDGEGKYSGTGNYLQRFKTLNFLINSTNGAQFQAEQFKTMKSSMDEKIANNTDKLATLSNLARVGTLSADSKGTNTISLSGATQFSVADTVFVTATDLPTIKTSITGISGSNVTLSSVVPKTYTKELQANIAKPV